MMGIMAQSPIGPIPFCCPERAPRRARSEMNRVNTPTQAGRRGEKKGRKKGTTGDAHRVKSHALGARPRKTRSKAPTTQRTAKEGEGGAKEAQREKNRARERKGTKKRRERHAQQKRGREERGKQQPQTRRATRPVSQTKPVTPRPPKKQGARGGERPASHDGYHGTPSS
ncbi:hypothetical protein BC940DRAFT_300179 [Gongronella butleri]|nr:hypothetical protein BC940DRAFT_300179 [Gongronella butleri]